VTTLTCTCPTERDSQYVPSHHWDETLGWMSCALHVECDDVCKALRRPATIEEYEAALEHWQLHSESGGCSHGC
jgi:hypothetical protein